MLLIDGGSATNDLSRTLEYEPNGNAIFNDDENMIRAALNGVGLMKHLDLVIEKYLQEGSLVRVLEEWCQPFPGFICMCRPERICQQRLGR